MNLVQIKDKAKKESVLQLLRDNNLPAEDIAENTLLFGFMKNDSIVGTAGLEIFDNCALVRSVSMHQSLQGKGLGIILQHELEQIALTHNIQCLYLLTTTAEGFFRKQGFNTIERKDVPESIQATSEFSNVCPASAIVMQKILSPVK